ncbi:hypothetical protein EC957_010593 [Mortierella hygrophila]|uniref:Uncharacterized protein n=1 Tax=Mortierella hygrophila TaxID=979708 RepID=A0A9P6FAQ9_9FUNG|nr:hypothetical protein EC957_010593 [Mortierella hygrophila]
MSSPHLRHSFTIQYYDQVLKFQFLQARAGLLCNGYHVRVLWSFYIIHLSLAARFDHEALGDVKDADKSLAYLDIETCGAAVVTQILMVAPTTKSIKLVISKYFGGPVDKFVKLAFRKHASTLNRLDVDGLQFDSETHISDNTITQACFPASGVIKSL